MSFLRLLSTPENRAALLAARRVAARVGAGRPGRDANPLVLHGPPGTGKTLLVTALVEEAARRRPGLIATVVAAGTFRPSDEQDPGAAARQSDLFIVEDLQHLPAVADVTLVQVLDYLYARGKQLVFTASDGPGQLPKLSTRLVSRLAGGLVVGLLPYSPASRLALLRHKARQRQLEVGEELLRWLADHLVGGGRQLDGAVTTLEGLARLHPGPLDVATVAPYFRDQVEASRPTLERIVERVGVYYRVAPRLLQSARRSRGILLPRQVSMYLARELTGLSLEKIGAYFGGRDPTTVLHACRKIEEVLGHDAALSGAVRQLQADLV